MHKAKNFNSKETTFREVRENPPAKQENKKRVILKNTKKKINQNLNGTVNIKKQK